MLSLKEQGKDCYKVERARNAEAFPDPRWPKQSLTELIEKAFAGRMIEDTDHPCLGSTGWREAKDVMR